MVSGNYGRVISISDTCTSTAKNAFMCMDLLNLIRSVLHISKINEIRSLVKESETSDAVNFGSVFLYIKIFNLKNINI